MKLKSTGLRAVNRPSARTSYTYTYTCQAGFPGRDMPAQTLRLIALDLDGFHESGRQIIALIGRDILSQFVVTYDGPEAKLAFRATG